MFCHLGFYTSIPVSSMKDDLRQQNKPPAASREQGTEEATCGYLFLVEFGGRNGLCCPCCRLPAGARRTVPPPDVERAHRRGIPAPFASLRAQIVDEPARARDTRQLPKRTGAYHGQLPRRAIRRAHRRHQLQPGRRRARQPAEPAVRPRVRRPLRHRRHVGRPAVRPHEPHGATTSSSCSRRRHRRSARAATSSSAATTPTTIASWRSWTRTISRRCSTSAATTPWTPWTRWPSGRATTRRASGSSAFPRPWTTTWCPWTTAPDSPAPQRWPARSRTPHASTTMPTRAPRCSCSR